jgi:DNA-binding transcriptional MerR regulator
MSGYRVFSDEALRRLRFIRHAKDLGFSLDEIRELLTLRVNSIDTCDRVRERAEVKIADIERKIQALQHMSDALSELVAACSRRGRTKDCPILDSLEANGWFEDHIGCHNG